MHKYDTAIVEEKVSELIKLKCEGAYWDFKREWHSNKARLLHDILCMANNLVAEDGYIIIGVENNGAICGVEADKNRMKQADIINWLSQIPFASDIPEIQVYQDVKCESGQVDVIIVVQKNNGPYFIKEKYPKKRNSDENEKIVLPLVYTRIGDTNTHIDKSATFSQIETLWRKRLGLLYNVQEKAATYIYDLDNWEYVLNDKEESLWYYKGDPAYTITLCSDDETSGIERIKSINSNFYYLCTFLGVSYHPGIWFGIIFLKYNNIHLFKGLVPMVDECRTKVLDGKGYFVSDSLEYGMYEFIFHHMCSGYSEEAKQQIELVIPIYTSEKERQSFEEFARSEGWPGYYSLGGPCKGKYKKRIDLCEIGLPKEPRTGALVNFYNEADYSQDEQEKITHRLKEGFVLVEMLREWREQNK